MSLLRLSAVVTGVVYLTWRLVFTWEGAHPVMFFLLLAAEAFQPLDRVKIRTMTLRDQ